MWWPYLRRRLLWSGFIFSFLSPTFNPLAASTCWGAAGWMVTANDPSPMWKLCKRWAQQSRLAGYSIVAVSAFAAESSTPHTHRGSENAGWFIFVLVPYPSPPPPKLWSIAGPLLWPQLKVVNSSTSKLDPKCSEPAMFTNKPDSIFIKLSYEREIFNHFTITTWRCN